MLFICSTSVAHMKHRTQRNNLLLWGHIQYPRPKTSQHNNSQLAKRTHVPTSLDVLASMYDFLLSNMIGQCFIMSFFYIPSVCSCVWGLVRWAPSWFLLLTHTNFLSVLLPLCLPEKASLRECRQNCNQCIAMWSKDSPLVPSRSLRRRWGSCSHLHWKLVLSSAGKRMENSPSLNRRNRFAKLRVETSSPSRRINCCEKLLSI